MLNPNFLGLVSIIFFLCETLGHVFAGIFLPENNIEIEKVCL